MVSWYVDHVLLLLLLLLLLLYTFTFYAFYFILPYYFMLIFPTYLGTNRCFILKRNSDVRDGFIGSNQSSRTSRMHCIFYFLPHWKFCKGEICLLPSSVTVKWLTKKLSSKSKVSDPIRKLPDSNRGRGAAQRDAYRGFFHSHESKSENVNSARWRSILAKFFAFIFLLIILIETLKYWQHHNLPKERTLNDWHFFPFA